MGGSKLKLRGHVVARFSRYWERLQATDAAGLTVTPQTRDATSTPAESTTLTGVTTLATDDITEGQPRAAPIYTPSNGVLETFGATLAELETVLDVLPSLRSVISGLRVCLALADVHVGVRPRQEYENIATNLASICRAILIHIVQLHKSTIPHSVHVIIRDIRQLVIQIKLGRERHGIQSMQSTGAFVDQEIARYYSIVSLLTQLQVDVQEACANVQERLMDTIITHQREAPAFNALYNAVLPTETYRHTYAPNPGLGTLNSINTWAAKTDGPKILWITGIVGSGKTTVTHAVCGQFNKEKRLGASFFCSDIVPDCRDAHRIIPTISFQLARFSREYWDALFKPLEVQSDLGASNIITQFNRLLVTPLLRVKEALPKNTIVVIDALDECADAGNARAFLELLLRYVDRLPIKFLLTSRPDLVVTSGLSPDNNTVQLCQVDQTAHIRPYLDEVLSPIPSSYSINTLSEIAGCQFIFATTAFRYLFPDHELVNNIHRLATVLYTQARSDDTSRTGLDKLYATILSNAFDNKDPVEVNSRQLVLWSIVRTREPITTMAIADLLGLITREDVVLAIRPLWSVVHISSTTGVVSLRHRSFREFLLDPKRSGKYHCHEVEHSEFLACRCFVVMEKLLRFNICGLETSTSLDKDVSDLPNRVTKAIPPVLSSACRYWAEYLKKAGPSSIVVEHLDGFLRRRLLFWMEVLNLKGWIKEGEKILLQVLDWFPQAGTYLELRKFILDAHDFIKTYGTSAASSSTPHIYLSSLPFTSKESWIYKNYWPQMQGLFVVRGTPKKICRRQKCHATSAALSPDGSRVATGSEAGAIFVWDLTHSSRLFGSVKHSAGASAIRSITFSPDGAFIASGSDNGNVGIWDAQTGQTLGSILNNNKSRVLSVAFVPDGSRILIACEDGTTHIYNLHYHTLQSDRSIPASLIKHFTFSPTGTYALFTESGGRNARLHNFSNPALLATKAFHDKQIDFNGAGVFAISPDGRRMASSTMRGEIFIWDVYLHTLVVGPFKGHNAALLSITFSSDGGRLATTSYDQTLRTWDAFKGTPLAPPFRKPWADLESNGDDIHAEFVLFSPDGNHVISVWGDSTICSWDLQDPRLQAFRLPSGLPSPGFYDWRANKLDRWVKDPDSRLMLSVPREYEDLLVSLPDPSLAPCSSIISHDRPILESSGDIMLEERWRQCYVGPVNAERG